MNNYESTTGLHEAIEDPAERQKAIDRAIMEHALAGDRGPDQKRIAEVVAKWGAMLLRKNSDYGSSVWKPPVLAPHLAPGDAIRVRMSDKIERLIKLAESGSPEVAESIEDTEMDFAAYVLLKMAMPDESTEQCVAPCDAEVRWYQDCGDIVGFSTGKSLWIETLNQRLPGENLAGEDEYIEDNDTKLTTGEVLCKLARMNWQEGWDAAREFAGLGEEEAYDMADKASGISPGDWVRTDRAAKTGEFGWNGEFNDFMHGKVGWIARVGDSELAEKGEADDWPFFVLTKLEGIDLVNAQLSQAEKQVEEMRKEPEFSVGEWVRLSGEFWCVVSIPSVGRVELIGSDATYPYSCPVDDLEKLPKVGEWVDAVNCCIELPAGTLIECFQNDNQFNPLDAVVTEASDFPGNASAKWIENDGWVMQGNSVSFKVTKYPPMPVVEEPGPENGKWNSVPPGEGYRLVEPGEKLLRTDQRWDENRKEWESRLSHGILMQSDFTPQRRKVEPATPDPGPGWRLVDKEKDTPQEGDEFWSKMSKKWQKCYGNMPGDSNGQFIDGDIYRRRDFTQWQEPVGLGGKYPVPAGTRIEIKGNNQHEGPYQVLTIADDGPEERCNAQWDTGVWVSEGGRYQWRVVSQ